MAERILINYNHEIDYDEDNTNIIGANTDTTGLRTVPVPGGDIAYVRKFGTIFDDNGAMGIGAMATTTGAGESLLYTFTSIDGGTSFGNVTDVNGVLTDNTSGTISSGDGMKIVLSCSAGAAVNNETSFTIRGVTVVLPDETLSNGDSITFYISNTGSSYYDSSYMYGGARHTPALNDADLPYFTITSAIAACASANDDGVEVLDSATYDEELDLNLADFYLYSTAGQTPTITSGIGARVSREVAHDGNNTDTAYVSKTGNDANAGTYQEPYLTIAAAFAGIGARTSINIMDSEEYEQSINITAGIILEPIYSKVPIIKSNGATYAIQITTNTEIYGLIITTDIITTDGIKSATGAGVKINDNTIYNFSTRGINISAGAFTGEILRNRCYSCGSVGNTNEAGIRVDVSSNGGGVIENNICYYGKFLGIRFVVTGAAVTDSTDIKNNLCYRNEGYGFYLWVDVGCTWNGSFENNTSVYNDEGIYAGPPAAPGTFPANLSNSIVYFNTTVDLHDVTGIGITIIESDYGTNNGFTIGAGMLQVDPLFMDASNNNYALKLTSTLLHADSNNDDMGAHFRSIEINNDNIEINGFFVDGQEQYNVSIFIADNTDHTGTIIKWNDIFDYAGLAIDLYDDGTNTDADIMYNRIYQNGNGIKLAYGGNEIEYNIIFDNTIFGIWSDYTLQEFIHNSIYGNYYGLYLESNSAGITCKDNISSQNSYYGIYSEVAIIVTYCNITDAVNSSVDNSDSSNIIDLPLFVNTNEGTEDFHLKSIYGGYINDSPCIGTASDDTDIGAWQVTRTIANDDWKKYQVPFNPQVEWINIPKGAVQFNDAIGRIDNWAQAHRRGFVFTINAPQVSNEALRQKFEYFSTLIQKRENTIVDEQTKFRIHFQPTSFLLTGTGTVDSSGLTLTDTTKSMIENQFKGFYVGIKYASGVATGTITAATKILQVAPDPTWTNDEWIGYYFYYNGYYYYILDNDSDELTLSDPNDTLANAANIDWSIEKYFKINENSETVLTVSDNDSELPSGSYDYYIDFIECKINKLEFGYSQPRFFYTREHSKTGFNVSFEEV